MRRQSGTHGLENRTVRNFIPALLFTLAGLMLPPIEVRAQSVLADDAHTRTASNSNFGSNPNVVINGSGTVGANASLVVQRW
jgi:hypothetical protein